MAFEDGPYIQTACFCEMVLEDKAGVLSLIRIVDTVVQTASGANTPDDMPPMPYTIKLVIMLKSGNAKGRSTLRIVPQWPTGEAKSAVSVTVFFEGEEKGSNLVTDMSLVFDVEGLYWFDIHLDDQKVTSIPLRVRYNRIATSTTTR